MTADDGCNALTGLGGMPATGLCAIGSAGDGDNKPALKGDGEGFTIGLGALRGDGMTDITTGLGGLVMIGDGGSARGLGGSCRGLGRIWMGLGRNTGLGGSV